MYLSRHVLRGHKSCSLQQHAAWLCLLVGSLALFAGSAFPPKASRICSLEALISSYPFPHLCIGSNFSLFLYRKFVSKGRKMLHRGIFRLRSDGTRGK